MNDALATIKDLTQTSHVVVDSDVADADALRAWLESRRDEASRWYDLDLDMGDFNCGIRFVVGREVCAVVLYAEGLAEQVHFYTGGRRHAPELTVMMDGDPLEPVPGYHQVRFSELSRVLVELLETGRRPSGSWEVE